MIVVKSSFCRYKSFFVLGITVLFLSFPCFGHSIQLQSDVVNGRLVPSIVINGQTTMMIQDRGNRKLFQSNYDRAEKIYASLIELEEKGLDISSIRVRRYKSEYSGQIGKNRIFTIYKGDIVANNLSAYKLAKKWTMNIKAAVVANEGPQMTSLGASGLALTDDFVDKTRFPIMGIVTNLGNKGLGAFTFQLLFFALMQLGIAVLVVLVFNKKQRERDRLFFTRLDKLHYILKHQKQELKDMSASMERLKKQGRSKPISIAKEGNASGK